MSVSLFCARILAYTHVPFTLQSPSALQVTVRGLDLIVIHIRRNESGVGSQSLYPLESVTSRMSGGGRITERRGASLGRRWTHNAHDSSAHNIPYPFLRRVILAAKLNNKVTLTKTFYAFWVYIKDN